MRSKSTLLLVLLLPVVSAADSSQAAKRDAALKQINACIQRNKASSRECRKLNANVGSLVEIYKAGDKTVLPTLLHFTYLTGFYDDALLADPSGFLTAVGELPDKDQRFVADGIAGGMFGIRSKERFEALREVLRNVPESDSANRTSQLCLKALERRNAEFLVDYFPPQTFTSRAASLQVHGYSSEMYALGEKPIWAPATAGTIYRLTYPPSFHGSTVITLTVSPAGDGQIEIKSTDSDRGETIVLDETTAVPPDQLAKFLALLDQAHFWVTPTELPAGRGLDGATWMMEGVQDGKYRTVTRWCPIFDHRSAEEISFGHAGQFLFELTGHAHTGNC
jgi:hypothetical protein